MHIPGKKCLCFVVTVTKNCKMVQNIEEENLVEGQSSVVDTSVDERESHSATLWQPKNLLRKARRCLSQKKRSQNIKRVITAGQLDHGDNADGDSIGEADSKHMQVQILRELKRVSSRLDAAEKKVVNRETSAGKQMAKYKKC